MWLRAPRSWAFRRESIDASGAASWRRGSGCRACCRACASSRSASKSSSGRVASNARTPLHELPLEELRARLADRPVRAAALRALRLDLRAGAQALLAELERRLEREAAERAHLRSLYRADARLRTGAVIHLS